uniref:Dynein light chain n=1 Tax=Sander lucioperca TaxID=283035 RepID=A0A8C9YEJ1_SANLU
MFLTEQNGHLTQVEVYEMLGLMSHVAAKVPPNDAVPGRVIFLVKLLDIFLDVVLLQGLCGTLNGVLLHVLRHVGIFYHCLSFRHGCPGKPKHSGGFIIIFIGALAHKQCNTL